MLYLFHGTADKTIDWQQTEGFADILKQANVSVNVKYYKNKSHTDPVLEDPVKGSGDEFMTDLLQVVVPGSGMTDYKVGYEPDMLLQWAKFVNPF